MLGMCNLLSQHAPLEAILSGSKYSPFFCQPHKLYFCALPFSYPSKGVWGPSPHVKKQPLTFSPTALPKANKPLGAHSPISIFQVGVWGLAPMVKNRP